jgi:hypothetical protein
MGAGVVLAGRAIDFAGPVALGWGVVWLAAVVAATCLPVLGALEDGEGTMRRARIGGLGCLAASVGVALVPPGPGFAVLWQMLRALQTLPVMPVVGVLAAIGACAAAAFATAGVLRLVRAGFAAGGGHADPGALVRGVMLGHGGLGVVAGAFPGAVIALAGGESEIAYGPGLVAGGLVGLCAIAAVLAQRFGGGGHRVIPVEHPVPQTALPGLSAGRAARSLLRLRARLRQALAGVDGLALPLVAAGVLVGVAGLSVVMVLLRVAA